MNIFKNMYQGLLDSWVKAFATRHEYLGLITWTHILGGESSQQAVLWLPQLYSGRYESPLLHPE